MRIKLRKPRPFLKHQQEAFDNYCTQRRHLAIFHEMRLGKTLLVIRWVKWLKDRPLRILVLAPISALGGWERELQAEDEVFLSEYGNGKRHRALDGFILHDADIKKRVWFLTNPEVLIGANLHYLSWDVVIVDESTWCKNARAKRTQNALGGFRNANHRVIMSGLPNPEGDQDLVCQYLFLYGQFMSYRNYWDWRAKVMNTIGYESWIPRAAHMEIKEYLHQTASVLSAKQAGMECKTVRQSRDIPIPTSLKKAYDSLRKNFALSINGEEFETKWAITLELWLARLAGGFGPDGVCISNHKILELCDLLTGELKRQQVVVGFRFNDEIREVQKYLESRNIEAPVMWGNTENKKGLEQEFLSGKHRIMLVQTWLGRGLQGVDLSSCSTIVQYSLHWSNEVNYQFEKRIDHPHKKEPNLVLYLCSKGTVDEEVVEGIKVKKLNSKMLLTNFRKEMGL